MRPVIVVSPVLAWLNPIATTKRGNIIGIPIIYSIKIFSPRNNLPSSSRQDVIAFDAQSVYFSIVQTPNDFSSPAELEQRSLAFRSHYERTASPFKWTFTRNDLHAPPARIDAKRLASAA